MKDDVFGWELEAFRKLQICNNDLGALRVSRL
jgi:hypothetical protein